MKQLLLCAILLFCTASQEDCQSDLEYAYFYGQLDAIEGIVNIRRVAGGTWVWMDNPWGESRVLVNDTLYDVLYFN